MALVATYWISVGAAYIASVHGYLHHVNACMVGGCCACPGAHLRAQILPELKRKLVELMRRRMQRYLQRASDNERSHWCATAVQGGLHSPRHFCAPPMQELH